MPAVSKDWVPDRRDVIWTSYHPHAHLEVEDELPLLVLSPKSFNERTGLVVGLPMTSAATNETNPFAVKFTSPKGEVCYVLCHQPKSLSWRERGARPHAWKQVSPAVFEASCEELNGIISICVGA